MRFSVLSYTAMLLIWCLVSCNLQNHTKLIATNCTDEVPTQTNLSFTFSKDLVSDSLLQAGGWQDEKYIKFTPEIEGSYRWENGSTLIFSPAQALLPATSFTAEITDAVCKFSKYKLANTEILRFHTPNQSIVNFSAQWVITNATTREIGIQSDVFFAYEPNLKDVKNMLTLKINGNETPFTFVPTEEETKSSLLVKIPQPEDKEYSVSISIKKGLVPYFGKNATQEELKANFALVSPFTLSIGNTQALHDGLSGSISVSTSQKIVSSNLKSFIKISPAVNFEIHTTDEGFLITSENFDANKMYELTIQKGLKGILGAELKQDNFNTIGFGELEPNIAFVDKTANYLSAKGNKNILVNIVNVPKVKLLVKKVYESNLLAALRYGTSDSYYDYDNEDPTYVVSDVVYEEEISTAKLQKKGEARILNFNFKDKLPEFNGIYSISLRSTGDYWVSDMRLISSSDIGIIARKTANSIVLFTNSLNTANALGNVELKIYGINNQIIGNAKTDNFGNAVIPLKKYEAVGFNPALITAKLGKDFNYLSLSNSRVETSRFDVGGKSISSTGLDAFIYGERDMYRPGETINISAIIRTTNWKPAGIIPVKIQLKSPTGQLFKSFKKTLNTQGSFEAAFELPSNAITGSYLVELYTPNDVLLASKSILVEEFMPDRIKVTTHLTKEKLGIKDTLILNGNAQNLFGTPATERKYEIEVQYSFKNFSSKKFPNFNFSLSRLDNYFENTVKEGNTDANGNFKEAFELPSEIENRGIINTSLFTTVFDETGRPVNRYNNASIFTQKVFLGLQQSEYDYFPLNNNIRFGIVALNENENLISTQARIQIIKHEYKTVLTKGWESYRYESQQVDKVLSEQTINISGQNTAFNFIPRIPGDYEIRVLLPNATSYVAQQFYSYGNWGSNPSNFEVNKEGNIDIALDKESYKAGEQAKLLFKAPFNGKMLVTVERDDVLEEFYLNIENRTATASIKLNNNHLPNVYVTATLFKAHKESDIPLTVAHGFKNITVSEPSRKIDVKIQAAEKVRSNTHQKVSVNGAPNSLITLAVVDEGVLQITDYKTPNPYNFFYEKQALSVTGYDFYANIFPEIKGKISSVGGDGFDLSKRTNPIASKRVKLVRYWSGIQKTNSSGTASFEFDIPQFSGQLRLMAVNYVNEKFGSAEASMKVSDPIILSSGLPRFLSPGDEAVASLTLSNTTSKSMSVNISVEANGAVSLKNIEKSSLTIPANAESRITYSIAAKEAIGEAKVIVKARAGNETFTELTELPVRPSASLQKATGNGEIAAGKTQAIAMGSSDFIKGTEAYSLVVSNSPLAAFGKNLSDLIQYPFGCTEQITAAAFPQIYFPELSEAIGTNQKDSKSASYNVTEAIKKIKMRQLYSGGVVLWENEAIEHWWASVFAAHFLIEAKQAGYEVDDDLLNPLLRFLEEKLRNKKMYKYYFNRGNSKMIAAPEIPYSLYVLSLSGKTPKSTMNYYRSNINLLNNEGRFLLAAAYALGGDQSKLSELLLGNFSSEIADKDLSNNFTSGLRNEALALTVLLKVQPENKQISMMAKHIAEALKTQKYLSTQELAFSITALGKLAKQNTGNNISATVKIQGKTLGEMNNSSIKIPASKLTSNQIEITTKGSGKLYYFWEAEGISASGNVKEGDNYLKVRRTFYDRYGKPKTNLDFKQNELIVVAISLENTFGRDIDNVVITDMLPAGFEIENARINEIQGMNWIKNESYPTYTDVRDDRINLFVNSGNKRQTYYYAVRAVSTGTFKLGTLSADAMYAGEYHSYSGSGTIKIMQK